LGGKGPGVRGRSEQNDGVIGFCKSNQHAGVSAGNDSGGFGVWARGNPAGHFEGDVNVQGNLVTHGDILLPSGGDLAEDFEISGMEKVEPGTLMVIGQDGKLHQSREPYDRRVAGVISGAGEFRPAIILDKQESRASGGTIALVGKVYCKVDSRYD